MDAIVRERIYGCARCGLVKCHEADPLAAARRFGLQQPDAELRPVSRAQAVAVLEALLWKDLAYATEMMPRRRAAELAREFVNTFSPEATFFSNGEWDHYHEPRRGGFGWSPLTDSVFDGGVIALDGELAGCVWVEDED